MYILLYIYICTHSYILYSIASRIPPGLGPGAYKVAPWRPSEGVPEVSWRGPGEALEAPGGVWEASWNVLACKGHPRTLLEASGSAPGSKKNYMERLLAGPRGILREVSAILGSKKPPKRRPKVCQIEFERQLELKMAKP